MSLVQIVSEVTCLQDCLYFAQGAHSNYLICIFWAGDSNTNVNYSCLTHAIFIDFRKAFDSINHTILLKKISKLGFHGNTTEWFKSYLSNRTQCTIANNMTSSFEPVTCGVPQGSVLGPLLFLIFISDLGAVLMHSAHKFYADDTVLYTSNPSDVLARDQLQTDFNCLAKWCDNNLLSMNIKKTTFKMTFGTKQKIDKVPQLTINFKGKNIEQVNTSLHIFRDTSWQ